MELRLADYRSWKDEEAKRAKAVQMVVDKDYELQDMTSRVAEMAVKCEALEKSWTQAQEKLQEAEKASQKKINELKTRLDEARVNADDAFNELQVVRSEAQLEEERMELKLAEVEKKASDFEWRLNLAIKTHEEASARNKVLVERAARKAFRKARREAATKYKARFLKIERALQDAKAVEDNALVQSLAKARLDFIDLLKKNKAEGVETDLDAEREKMAAALEEFQEELNEMDVIKLDLAEDLRVSPVSVSSEGSHLTAPSSSAARTVIDAEVSSAAATAPESAPALPAPDAPSETPAPSTSPTLQIDQFGSNAAVISPSTASELGTSQARDETREEIVID